MRQSGQRTAGTDDVFDLGQVFALCQSLSAGRSVDVADLTRMPFDCPQNSFFGQTFDQFKFVFILRDRYISFQCFIQIDVQFFLTFLAQFFFADGLDDFHAVDINAEVALYGPLCLRLRRGQDPGYRVGILRYRMYVGGRAADVDDHAVTDTVIEQLRAFHNSTRRRDDRAVDHVSDVFHARRLGDIIFKGFLNDLAARFNVQSIDLRIDVVDQIQLLSAFLVEDQLHFLLIFNVAGINDRRMQPHIADHFRVVDGRIAFAIVHAAGDQDQIRIDLLDLCQVASSQSAYGNVVDNAAGTEGCLSGRLGRHIVNQSVYGHLQTARCRGCRQHFVIFQTVDVHFFAKVIDRPLQSDADIPFQYRGRRLSLCPENRIFAVQIFERVDNGRCRADLCN